MKNSILGTGAGLLTALCLSCGSPSGDADYSLIPVAQSGRYGYVNSKGEYVINPQFDEATMFREGIARVKKDGKYGYIRKDGNYLCLPTYVDATIFREGIAWVVEEKGAPTAIDTEGKRLFTLQEAYSVSCYSEGLARFGQRNCENGKILSGYLDKRGNVVIPPVYTSAGAFGQGLAAVSKDWSPHGYINPKGEVKINYQFVSAGRFDKQGRAIVGQEDKEMRYGVIDKQGKFVIRPQFALLHGGGDRYRIKLERGSDYGYCDAKGKLVINPQFEDASPFGDSDLAPVQVGEMYGYIDKKGAIKISPQFEGAASFFSDCAPVFSGDKIGLINRKGEYVANPQFNGLAYDYFLPGEEIVESSFCLATSQYIHTEGVAGKIRAFLADGKLDGMAFPPSVEEVQRRYKVDDKKVPVYDDWEQSLGYWDNNLTAQLALNGFFYKEESDGWWGTKRVLDKQAKADRVQLHILLHATASGRSAEVADGLSAALKDGYGDYRFNIRSKTNNEVIIEITK